MPTCPDCETYERGRWRTGVCDACKREESRSPCDACGGTGSPVCCRCEGTGVDPHPNLLSFELDAPNADPSDLLDRLIEAAETLAQDLRDEGEPVTFDDGTACVEDILAIEPPPARENNEVQFARLLSEIQADGVSEKAFDQLTVSMDLVGEDLVALFDRAHTVWEAAKEQA